ncbi:MAG: DoxX family protein [Gammaproteobacteria bacterium]|nr:DoxX family protein [Gammaproteobacteria bacterium]
MAVYTTYDTVTARLRASGDFVWPLALRLILAWEFYEAGMNKLQGTNWFADIPWADWQKGFPFPFDQIPVDLNWSLATLSELGFAAMLVLGLFTRFAAISLVVITAVATAAVHWPAEWGSLAELWSGYVITPDDAGNYKIPLLFVVMLLPLVFHGGGKLSLDHLFINITGRNNQLDDRTGGLQSAGLALLVLSLATIWVEPMWGISLLVASALAMVIPEMIGKD